MDILNNGYQKKESEMPEKRTDKLLVTKPEKQRNGKEECPFYFYVMQSLKHNKWVLAAVRGNFASYEVTDVMDSNVERMVQGAAYLNEGRIGPELDGAMLARLDTLKKRYCADSICAPGCPDA